MKGEDLHVEFAVTDSTQVGGTGTGTGTGIGLESVRTGVMSAVGDAVTFERENPIDPAVHSAVNEPSAALAVVRTSP